MPSDSRFKLSRKRKPAPLEIVATHPFVTLIAAGIVNPFGPTLEVLAIDGSRGADAPMPLIHMMLNPFNHSVELIGEAVIGDRWNLLTDVPPLFDELKSGCPTLIVPSKFISTEAAIELYATLFLRYQDGFSVLAWVRRFPGVPWDRLKAVLAGGAHQWAQSGAVGAETPGARRLTPEESKELAANLLEPNQLAAELNAFIEAWTGSIGLLGENNRAWAASSGADFIRAFQNITESCRLPVKEGGGWRW